MKTRDITMFVWTDSSVAVMRPADFYSLATCLPASGYSTLRKTLWAQLILW